MGNECVGGDRMREVVNMFAGSLSRMFGCRVGSAKSLQDGIPQERAPGQGVIRGRSKVRYSRRSDCLRLLLRIRRGKELDGRFVDGSIHRER